MYYIYICIYESFMNLHDVLEQGNACGPWASTRQSGWRLFAAAPRKSPPGSGLDATGLRPHPPAVGWKRQTADLFQRWQGLSTAIITSCTSFIKKNQTGSKNQVESSESTGMQTSIQSKVAIICTVVENMTNTGVGCAFWLATCKMFMPASDGCCSNHCAIVIEVHVSLGRNSSNCPKFCSCDQSLPLQERKNPSVSLVLLCEPFPCSHGSFDCQFTLPGSSSLFPQPGKTRWPLHVDAFGRFKCIKMQK